MVLLLSRQFGGWRLGFLLSLLLNSDTGIGIAGRQSFHVDSVWKYTLPGKMRTGLPKNFLGNQLVCLVSECSVFLISLKIVVEFYKSAKNVLSEGLW